jgi:hypothetical protein
MILVTSKPGKPFSVAACLPHGTDSLCARREPRRTLARRRSS